MESEADGGEEWRLCAVVPSGVPSVLVLVSFLWCTQTHTHTQTHTNTQVAGELTALSKRDVSDDLRAITAKLPKAKLDDRPVWEWVDKVWQFLQARVHSSLDVFLCGWVHTGVALCGSAQWR